jgi:hypothetical protein
VPNLHPQQPTVPPPPQRASHTSNEVLQPTLIDTIQCSIAGRTGPLRARPIARRANKHAQFVPSSFRRTFWSCRRVNVAHPAGRVCTSDRVLLRCRYQGDGVSTPTSTSKSIPGIFVLACDWTDCQSLFSEPVADCYCCRRLAPPPQPRLQPQTQLPIHACLEHPSAKSGWHSTNECPLGQPCHNPSQLPLPTPFHPPLPTVLPRPCQPRIHKKQPGCLRHQHLPIAFPISHPHPASHRQSDRHQRPLALLRPSVHARTQPRSRATLPARLVSTAA